VGRSHLLLNLRRSEGVHVVWPLQALTGFPTTVTVAATAVTKVQLDLQSMVNILNVLYVDMANLFIVIAEYDVRTSSGTTSWNQQPSSTSGLTGSTRHSQGCSASTAVSDDTDFTTTLTTFGTWRSALSAFRRYGAWFLFTNCYYGANVPYMTYSGAACNQTDRGVGWVTFQTKGQ
jgi:hypothetical protein